MKISDVYDSLSSAYQFWTPHFLNRNFVKMNRTEGSLLTWPSYDPAHLPFRVTETDLASMVNNRQFSFQVEDGSIVRMHYLFNSRGRVIQSASLSYYGALDDTLQSGSETLGSSEDISSPPQTEDSQDELEIINEFNEAAYGIELKDEPDIKSDAAEVSEEDRQALLEMLNEYNIATSDFATDRLVSYFRIDYAPHQAGGVLHHDCHLHISGFPSTRIMVSGLPTPNQFIEFIMAVCYPSVYRAKRLNPDGTYMSDDEIHMVNSPCFRTTSNAVYDQMTHLRIPKTLQ